MDAGGRLVAVLAARLNLKELSSIMEERSDLKATEDTYLVNPQNYFITEPRYGKEYALRKTVYTKGVQNALQGQDGTALYPDYRGVPVIGAYLYLPERNIALITEIDQEEYLAPIKRLQRTTLGIGALMAVLSLLVGWICADALLQPLLRLVAAVNKMGADNLVFTEYNTGKTRNRPTGEGLCRNDWTPAGDPGLAGRTAARNRGEKKDGGRTAKYTGATQPFQ